MSFKVSCKTYDCKTITDEIIVNLIFGEILETLFLKTISKTIILYYKWILIIP